MPVTVTSRRLLCLVPVLLGLALPSAGAKEKDAKFPSHVVMVLVGGGVRAADLGDPALMPRLAALGGRGRVIEGVASGAPDPYSAAMRILTGRAERIDAARLPRPRTPTLAEYVRRDLALPQEKVWYVSFEGGDHLHLAWSTDAAYGMGCRPGVASGLGAFAGPLAPFLESRGRPDPIEPAAWAVLRRLRLLSRDAHRTWLPKDLDAGLPSAERVERALLRELDRKRHPDLLRQTHPRNPRDEQAFRTALTVLAVHRPTLTILRLGEAEQAVASYEAYRAVLAGADDGIGRLEAAVAADAEMRGRTTFVVLADMGRNARPDDQGRLGADDASKQRQSVRVVFAGPGLARRGRVQGPRSLDDVCPTVAWLLGARTPAANGRVWRGLLNER